MRKKCCPISLHWSVSVCQDETKLGSITLCLSLSVLMQEKYWLYQCVSICQDERETWLYQYVSVSQDERKTWFYHSMFQSVKIWEKLRFIRVCLSLSGWERNLALSVLSQFVKMKGKLGSIGVSVWQGTVQQYSIFGNLIMISAARIFSHYSFWDLVSINSLTLYFMSTESVHEITWHSIVLSSGMLSIVNCSFKVTCNLLWI